MNKPKPSILITRPDSAGRHLQHCLLQQGYQSYCQPFFDYQAGDSLEKLQTLQCQLDKPSIIFISVAAVEYAHTLKPLSLWSAQQFIAVGSATAQALAKLGITALVPKNHDSEGLLALPELDNIAHSNFIIVRGDGGRELIADDLRRRGATVHYFESYRRVWRKYTADVIKTWQQQQINCILITSNALLEFIVNLLIDSDSYWKEQCLWIVASRRIAKNANAAGIKRVVNANGANTQAIMTAISLQHQAVITHIKRHTIT